MGGALGIYKALWKLLEDEYDVEPSKETQELIAKVKLGQPTGIATPESSRAPELQRPSSELAVADGGPLAKQGDTFARGRPQKLMLSIAP